MIIIQLNQIIFKSKNKEIEFRMANKCIIIIQTQLLNIFIPGAGANTFGLSRPVSGKLSKNYGIGHTKIYQIYITYLSLYLLH